MSALMQQHEAHKQRQARLLSGVPVSQLRPARSRPISPFAVEVYARREAEKKAREEAIQWRREHPPHWSAIVKQVAKKHDLNSRDLLGPSRVKKIVAARNEAIYRMRTEIIVNNAPLSFPMIGKRLNKNHSSILHGFYKHAALVGTGDGVFHSIPTTPRKPLTPGTSELARFSEPVQISLERNSQEAI